MRSPVLLALLALISTAVAAETPLGAGGALRVAYLSTNPAQAIRNVVTGEVKGASADLARELARRQKAEASFIGLASSEAVIEAVRKGEADIGFVAANGERIGAVAITQPYMLAQQSFLVREDSDIKAVADIDKPQRVLGANAGDPLATVLKDWAKQAMLKESADPTLQEALVWLRDGKIDAFAGNRQRLGAALRGAKGLRLLPDNFHTVPQAIVVAADKPDALAALDKTIDELRGSGFLKTAVEGSGVDGLVVAPGR